MEYAGMEDAGVEAGELAGEPAGELTGEPTGVEYDGRVEVLPDSPLHKVDNVVAAGVVEVLDSSHGVEVELEEPPLDPPLGMRHCEYHGFCTMHDHPGGQDVEPVQVLPPHWLYSP